jgi:clan AA aspartic protease
MISGVVDSLEARVLLTVRGPASTTSEVVAIVDTGFTGVLTLPPSLIQELQLEWRSIDRGTLADGSECIFDVFVAELEWDGIWFRVLVNQSEADPLIGMTLMEGYELTVQVRQQGAVRLQKMTQS